MLMLMGGDLEAGIVLRKFLLENCFYNLDEYFDTHVNV
jgi:hypothetical protein